MIAIVRPGDAPLAIPSFNGQSRLNLVSELGCSFTLFAYTSAGKPLGAPTLTLPGNQPGISGPVELSGPVWEFLGLAATDPESAAAMILVWYSEVFATHVPIANPYTLSVQ